jgi:hypothetical protein
MVRRKGFLSYIASRERKNRVDCSATARHSTRGPRQQLLGGGCGCAGLDDPQRQGNGDTRFWISRARERKRCGAFIDVHTGGALDDDPRARTNSG